MTARDDKIRALRTDRDGYACACAEALLDGNLHDARAAADMYGRACQQLNDMIREGRS